MAAMSRFPLHEDPKVIMREAFAIFDVAGKGSCDGSELRQVLGNLAERLTNNDCSSRAAPGATWARAHS